MASGGFIGGGGGLFQARADVEEGVIAHDDGAVLQVVRERLHPAPLAGREGGGQFGTLRGQLAGELAGQPFPQGVGGAEGGVRAYGVD